MWRNDKTLARKKNAELKTYLGETGNHTHKNPPKLTERENLIISIIWKETSEGFGLGEAGFGQPTLESNINEDLIEIVDTGKNDHVIHMYIYLLK